MSFLIRQLQSWCMCVGWFAASFSKQQDKEKMSLFIIALHSIAVHACVHATICMWCICINLFPAILEFSFLILSNDFNFSCKMLLTFTKSSWFLSVQSQLPLLKFNFLELPFPSFYLPCILVSSLSYLSANQRPACSFCFTPAANL